MGPDYESPNLYAYIVGLGVPDRVSQLSDRLIKDLIGMSGEVGRGMYEYSNVDKKEPEKGEKQRARRPGITTWPMESMVPILVCSGHPKAPVTGLLPPCESVIEVGEHLIFDRLSGWITLPVNSGGWFGSLQQKLYSRVKEHGKETAIHEDGPVLPLCLGLPLLCIDEYEREFLLKALEVKIDAVGGWRALPLICWGIEYLVHRPWHHSAYWVPIWKRRLRRAIGTFNGGENVA